MMIDCDLAIITVLIVIVIIIFPVHIVAFILRLSLRSGREERGEDEDNQEFEHDWRWQLFWSLNKKC